MQKIERLIEAEIPKLELPEALGAQPEWKVAQAFHKPKKNFKRKFKPNKPKSE